MCMIAYRPVEPGKRGGNIPNRVIDTAMTRHPDGFGVSWREDGEVKTAKFGPADKAAFRHYVKRIDARRDIEYVAHFRFATHGPKDEAHAHPYEYTDPTEGRVLVFHNGVIDIATTSAESDTEVFVRDVLARLPSAWWRDPAIEYLVGEAIGWSRLVLMTPTETVNLQADLGKWDNGLWYSSEHKPLADRYQGWSSGKGSESRSWDVTTYEDALAVRMLKGVADSQDTADKRREEWVDYETNGLILLPPATIRRYQHGGHPLTALKDFPLDVDGEYSDAVVCDYCATSGDAWVIDGQVLIDMGHREGTEVEDDEGEMVLMDKRARDEAELHRSPEYRLDLVH